MGNPARRTLCLSLVSLGISALACSDGEVPTNGGTDPSNEPCTELQVLEIWPDEIPGHFIGLIAGEPDRVLRIELAEVGDFRQTTGTFNLDQEKSYQTCSHCVLVLEGGYTASESSKVYLQESGTMTLTSVTSPPTQETAGTLSNVTLEQVVVDPATGQPTAERSNTCVRFPSLIWDTRVAVGSPCLRATDCGDTSTKACDPASASCVEQQCDDAPGACDAGFTCIAQTAGAPFGTCYEDCVPFASNGCGEGRMCVPRTLSQAHGMCLTTGTAVHGSPCESSDITTGCQAGLDCNEEPSGSVCRSLCDFFSASPDCPALERCTLGGLCTLVEGTDAGIGASCGSGSLYTSCGDDSAAYRGMCTSEEPGEIPFCRRLCRLGFEGDCSVGSQCEVSIFESVGFCMP